MSNRAVVAAIALVGACSPFGGGAFECTGDQACTGAAGGVCEPTGYCSFADPGCASGRRYGDASGPLAGQCVGDGAVDAPRSGTLDLVFDNTASSEPLVDFPVLVVLDGTRVGYGGIDDPTRDLRFHDPDTDTDLAFEVEQWDPTGRSFVWVVVPEIRAAAADDRIELVYGPTAAGTANPAGVWTSSYEAVWHLGDAAADPVRDSRASAHPGTATGTTPEPDGQIGAARAFTGAAPQTVEFDGALFDGWPTFSFELWIGPDYPSLAAVPGAVGVLDKGGSINLGRLEVRGTPSDLVFQTDLHFDTHDSYLFATTPIQVWTQLVYDFDGTTLRLYRNGALEGTDPLGSVQALQNANNPFYLGSTTDPFSGALDEVRLARVSRSPDWIFAQYIAMTDQMITYVAR